jgi:hypothetical protein
MVAYLLGLQQQSMMPAEQMAEQTAEEPSDIEKD